jgi:hypothetical protein
MSQIFLFFVFDHQGGNSLWSLDTGILGDLERSRATRQAASTKNASQVSIISWLQDLGLEKYLKVFVRAEIDWSSLPQLSEQDLIDLGIEALGPRKKLLAAIQNKRRARGCSHE